MHRPISRGVSSDTLLTNSLGDGSTLSLDFTTGILDPRLTFTRASDATFVNSSGFVEYAAANKFSNSIFTGASGTTAPTGWTFASIGGTGNLSLSGVELTISNNNSATRSRLYQNWGNSNGLPVTVQVRVVAKSGTFQLNELLAFSINGSTGEQYKVNGTNQSSGYTGWGAGDLITLTCTPAIGLAAWCVVGCGVSSPQATNLSVTIKDIQAEPGTVARSYIPTTTSGAYQAPRFDYDPTTLAPRGLLIEGQATNLMFRSQEIATSPWFNAGTMTVSNTGSGSPANDATSNVVTWTNGTGAGGAWLQQNVAVSAGALVVGTAYTWSIWLKNRGGRRVNVFAVLQGVTGNREVRVDFGVSPPTVTSTVATGWTSIQTPTIVEYPNGWYKITTGGTLPASVTSVNFGFSNADAVPPSGTNGFEAWGYQLEAGSGASSYIPTGASQGTRNADSCIMESTNFSTWWANPASWSMLLDFTPIGVVPGQTPDALRLINRASTNNSTWFYYYGASTMTLVSRIGNGTAVENNAATGQTYGNRAKVMHAIAPGVHTLSFNGSTVAAANTIASMPTGINALGIMNNGLSGALAAGHAAVRSVKFWPTALPQATLNSLTTL